MREKVKNGLVILLLAIMIIAGIRIALRTQKASDLALFNTFDTAAIKGKLHSVFPDSKGVAILVSGIPHKLIFYPKTNELLNQGNSFIDFAEPGDSIRKPRHSDTLLLLKHGIAYKYLFRRAG